MSTFSFTSWVNLEMMKFLLSFSLISSITIWNLAHADQTCHSVLVLSPLYGADNKVQLPDSASGRGEDEGRKECS